jgi:hypothetical protein
LHEAAATSRFNPNALTHRHIGERAPAKREEAFPALWDAQPQRLLRIATLARNHAAARFAAEALRQGPPRPDAMDVAAIGGLLASPYPEVNALAAAIARRLIDAGKAEAALIAALLEATAQELRDLAIRAIDDRADWPWADATLARAALTSPHDHVQGRTRGWLRDRAPSRDQRARATEAFAAWLALLPPELDDGLRAGLTAALALLPLLWPDRDCPLQPEVIESLTGHASPDVQAASIQLIAVTPTRPGDLPAAFWQAILQADAPEIRIASMILLARLDDAALAQHRDGITLAATGAHAGLRAAARPLVARLAATDDDFAIRLRDKLMAGFFRADPVEGHAADMVTLFADALPQAAAAIDDGTLWRLLQARAGGARMMGAKLLESRDPQRFSVRQLARLGNHPFAAVRRFALDAFAADEARFRADPAECRAAGRERVGRCTSDRGEPPHRMAQRRAAGGGVGCHGGLDRAGGAGRRPPAASPQPRRRRCRRGVGPRAGAPFRQLSPLRHRADIRRFAGGCGDLRQIPHPGPHHPDADQPRTHRQGPDLHGAAQRGAGAPRPRGLISRSCCTTSRSA